MALHGAILDAQLTMVMERNMVKVVAWYNEHGYGCHVADLAAKLATIGM